MKDKERLERRIENLECDLKHIRTQLYELQINHLTKLEVKKCETCGHETLHLKKFEDKPYSYSGNYTSASYCCPYHDYFLCTSCGSTTKCVTKEVCEPYTPQSDVHCGKINE